MAARPRAQRRAAPRPRRSLPQREVHPQWGRRFTQKELSIAWVAAGGPASEARTAGAVAYAESGGYEKRPNSSGDGGMGPWQITPAEPGSDTLRGNARQAVRKWKEARKRLGSAEKAWANQWVAYANGSYKQYLGPDKNEKFEGGSVGGFLEDAFDRTKKIPGGLEAIGKFALGLSELLLTEQGWKQIAKVVIGGALLLWALNSLSKSIFDVSPARGVRRVATSTPAGKVAGAAGKVASKAKPGGGS